MWLLHASETFLSLVEGGWLLTTKQIFQRIKKQRIANTTFLLEPLVLTLKWMPPFGTTWWSRWSRSTLLAGWDLSWWGVKRSAGLCIVVVWLVRLKNPKTFKCVHLKQPELLLNVKKSGCRQYLYKYSAGKGTTANAPVFMFLGILDFRKSAISLSSSFSLEKKITIWWHLKVQTINHQEETHVHRLCLKS